MKTIKELEQEIEEKKKENIEFLKQIYLEEPEVNMDFLMKKDQLLIELAQAESALTQTKAIAEMIEWYYNDLQKAINKTHDTEKYEITDGKMAKIIMEKGKLLLKEIFQKINGKEDGI